MADDPEADYTAYVHGHITTLRRLAYHLSGDEHDAADLVQETITKLYVRWSRLRSVDNLDAYVHRMLVRVFLDSRRRGWLKVLLGASPPERAAPPGPQVEEREVVRAALAQIPPRQRAVLVLRYLHDKPVVEVAVALGCSEGTVKSQAAHGLTALRRVLTGFEDAMPLGRTS